MMRYFFRFDVTQIAQVAAAVIRRIAVEQFSIYPLLRNTDSIPITRYGREVTDNNNSLRRICALAFERNNAGGAIMEINPVEAAIMEIYLVQGRFMFIECI